MKKKVLFVVFGLSMAMMFGGCGKKDAASELDGVVSEDKGTDTSTDETTDGTTEGAAEAPVREAYEVSDYITLGNYKGVEVTVTKLSVTDEDVDATIKSELEANPTEEEITGRPVQDGDIVNIDYEGLKDGVAFEGGTAQAYDLTIGSGSFIEGFEEKLIGAEIGQKLKLDLTFPEEYQSAELAGKDVVFNVTVNSIKTSKIPELTESYVKDFTDYDSVAAYKEATRKNLEENNKKTMEDEKRNNVLIAILNNSKVASYPQSLLDYYQYEMKSYYSQYATMYGMELKDFLAGSGMTEESFNEETKSYAESRVSQELVLNAIIKEEKMKLSDEEYKTGVEKILKDYGYESEEELLKSATEEQIKENLLWEKAMIYVSDLAVVK